MRHAFLTVVLTIGMVGGLCAGFHQMNENRVSRKSAWESRVADTCVDSAYRVLRAEQGEKLQRLAPSSAPKAKAEDSQ